MCDGVYRAVKISAICMCAVVVLGPFYGALAVPLSRVVVVVVVDIDAQAVRDSTGSDTW